MTNENQIAVIDLVYDFKCDECDFVTNSYQYLKTHQKFKHENEGIIYRCDICNQILMSK